MYLRASPWSSSSCLLVVIAHPPVTPGALEQGEPVEGGVDLLLVREHLLVLRERARVVEAAVEDGLRLRHVRVGDEAALRIVAQDPLEPGPRLVLLALLEGEEPVDVEREVVLLEPGVIAQHATEEIPRHAVVELGRRTALVDGFLVPGLEADHQKLPLVLPIELAEPDQGLRHFPGLARRLGHELLQEVDGFRPELLGPGQVGVDAGIEAQLEPLAQGLRELRTANGRLTRGSGPTLRPLRRQSRVRRDDPFCCR
jgi:hypothetical protein